MFPSQCVSLVFLAACVRCGTHITVDVTGPQRAALPTLQSRPTPEPVQRPDAFRCAFAGHSQMVQIDVHRSVRVCLLLHRAAAAPRVPERSAHSESVGRLSEATTNGATQRVLSCWRPFCSGLRTRQRDHSHTDRCGDRVHSVRDSCSAAEHRVPHNQCGWPVGSVGDVLDRRDCQQWPRYLHVSRASQFIYKFLPLHVR